MSQKRLLIADPVATEWKDLGQTLGDSWEVVGTLSGADALRETQKRPFDVVVANFDLAGPSAEELLNQIRAVNPGTLRFIAGKVEQKEKMMNSLASGNQFLAVPFDRAELKTSLERTLEADAHMSDGVRELIGRIRTFPTIPSIYLEVVNVLKSPSATTAEVGAIIAKDMSMTTKLIQVINSAYFGLPRTITDPTEAVGILGFDTVKSLVMTVKLLSQYDKVKPAYFSIDQIWKHSTNVARTARVMALLETNDADCSSAAFTAGLMHDLGKVILAANFDSQYQEAHNVARQRQIPLWQAEKEVFGATHAEIGACLLTRWGLSPGIVKVVALHHTPIRSGDKTFTPLTAVHVANALEYEADPDPDGAAASTIDCEYLERIGMANRIDLWRFARREPDTSRIEKNATRAASTAKQAAATARAVPSETVQPRRTAGTTIIGLPIAWQSLWRWLGVGLAAGLALAWLTEMAATQAVTAVKGKPDENPVADQPAAPIRSAEIQKISAAHAPPIPAPAVTAAPATPPPAPPKTGLDLIKLQAIFGSKEPVALINGKTVKANQEVEDCRVLSITPNSVTLEYQNQRKTFAIR